MKRGELKTAKDHLLGNLSIRRDVDDELGIGRCLNALGEVYYRLDALDRAEAYHKWGRRYLQRVGDEMGQDRFEYHMGNIEYQCGFLNEVIAHFQTAVEGFKEIGNSRGLAQAYLGLGRVARQLEAYEKAREHLSAGLEKFESLSAYSDAIQVVEELIDTCEVADNHAAVREWHDEKGSLQE